MAQDNILRTKELFEEVNRVLQENITNLKGAAQAYNTMSSSAKLPSDFVNGIKTYDTNNKNVVKSLKQLEAQEKKMQRARISELRLQKQREQAFDKYERQLQREQRQIEKTTGLYNRVQRGINSLTRQYNDLAIRKELNGKLSAEEEVQLGKLEAKLGKYQAALLKVDSRIGKHQRNVGNYKSTFDGLGFSVAQLSREMPAFANSMQTGFMAISNNIPMLVDEIQRLKRTNLELAASGKPTTSVLKSLGKAIFSLQGLLGVGITLLTVFAPKIIEWATGMSEAEKATKKATEELEKQNESIKENIRLREQQLKGVKDVINQSEIGRLLQDLSRFDLGFADLAEGEAILAEIADRLEAVGSNNAKVLKDANILQSDRVTIAANLLKIEELRNKLDKERLSVNENLAKEQEILNDKSISAQTRQAKLLQLGSTSLDETLRLQKEIVYYEEANQRLIGKTVFLEEQKTGEKKKQKELVQEIDQIGSETFRTEIEKLISSLEKARKLYTDNSKEARELDDVIQNLKNNISGYDEGLERANEQILINIKHSENQRKVLEKLQESTDKFIQSLKTGFFSDAGFSSINIFIDGTFDKLIAGAETVEEKFAVTFKAVSDVAKEAFAFINQFSQENFNAEYERLEQRKNIAIQFAGESTAARENIEKQYDEKRRQIERRQARQQKETAIFNTIINTAQAVVGALANPGGFAGIALSVVMGALGAAQIALISSQSIPQYAKGTDNHGGGLAVVGDGGKQEVIVTPDGKASLTPNKDTIVDMPKGSKVYPTYDNFMKSLNHELGINNIGMSDIQPMIINNGLSKDDIKSVMNEHGRKVVNAINNKTEFGMSWDENGIHKWVKKGNSKSIITNARHSGKGINV